MSENDRGCRYALDCWIDPDSTSRADATEYAATEGELRARVNPILKAGRFKSLLLYRFNSNLWSSDEIEEFSIAELGETECDAFAEQRARALTEYRHAVPFKATPENVVPRKGPSERMFRWKEIR